MGSSLRVQPVALIPEIIGDLSPETPQILVNRESVAWPHQFDYEMKEDCDSATAKLMAALGWSLDEPSTCRQGSDAPPREDNSELSSGSVDSDDELMGGPMAFGDEDDEDSEGQEDLESAMVLDEEPAPDTSNPQSSKDDNKPAE